MYDATLQGYIIYIELLFGANINIITLTSQLISGNCPTDRRLVVNASLSNLS